MPSSLAVIHSSTLVCSTRPPVSVCGTGRRKVQTGRFFLGAATRRCRLARRLGVLSRASARFNGRFRLPAGGSPLRRRRSPAPGTGMLTRCPSGVRSRCALRPRLTLIRLALIRKPWSCGGRVSHPPCRYSCLHLLFPPLQHGSRRTFAAAGMLPYRASLHPTLRHAA